MSFAENSNGFTPSFVSLALSGITHRFILVLECESRQYEGEVAVSHPRFCVGGPRATLDPRNVSITDLLPLGASKVDLPGKSTPTSLRLVTEIRNVVNKLENSNIYVHLIASKIDKRFLKFF